MLDGSPAADAGLQVGDIILKLDGKVVESSAALPPLVGRAEIGSRVEVLILRDGERRRLEVEVTALPDKEELALQMP